MYRYEWMNAKNLKNEEKDIWKSYRKMNAKNEFYWNERVSENKGVCTQAND